MEGYTNRIDLDSTATDVTTLLAGFTDDDEDGLVGSGTPLMRQEKLKVTPMIHPRQGIDGTKISSS